MLGSEFVLWFFRFLLLIIVIVMIVAAVDIFYSKQYDIRQAEAEIIALKLSNCLVKDGIMKEADFNSAFETCPQKINEREYYLNLSINMPSGLQSRHYGQKDLEIICQIKKSKLRYPPVCLRHRYYIVFDDGKEKRGINFDMLVAITKVEKNV